MADCVDSRLFLETALHYVTYWFILLLLPETLSEDNELDYEDEYCSTEADKDRLVSLL